MNDWLVLVGSVLGGGSVGGVLVAWIKREESTATAEEKRAAAYGSDVTTLRSVIAELRDDKRDTQVRLKAVEERLSKVEERERHMLTRAAVHEAWDQLALNFILTHDQDFPTPPPLSAKEMRESEGEYGK